MQAASLVWTLQLFTTQLNSLCPNTTDTSVHVQGDSVAVLNLSNPVALSSEELQALIEGTISCPQIKKVIAVGFNWVIEAQLPEKQCPVFIWNQDSWIWSQNESCTPSKLTPSAASFGN